MAITRGTKPCIFTGCIRKNHGDKDYCSGHARQRNRGEELKPIKYKAPNGQKATRREYQLKSSYGLTKEEYDNMVVAQNGRCAVCVKLPTYRGLFVDHCHTTGRVRGLLCNSCNSGIGQLQDNPELLSAARSYLIKDK